MSARRVPLIIVRAQDRADERREPAQHAIIVETRNVAERGFNALLQLARPSRTRGRIFRQLRIEAHAEERQDQRRDLRMCGERAFLHHLRRVEPTLLPVARQRAQQRRLTPAHAQRQDDAVEPVALGATAPDRGERGFERALYRREIERHAIGRAHLQIVQVNDPFRRAIRLREPQREIELRRDEQSHVLEDRQR